VTLVRSPDSPIGRIGSGEALALPASLRWGVAPIGIVLVGIAAGVGRPELGLVGVSLLFLPVVTRFRLILLGASLPIYSIGSLSPSVSLAARSGLFVLCLLPLHSTEGRDAPFSLPPWQWRLFIAAYAVTAVVHPSSTGLYLVFTLVVASMLGAKVGQRLDYFASLSRGYVFGVTLSAAAVLLNAMGLVDLSPVSQRLGGHTGLSYRSTAFAYDAALALVFWWSRRGDARGGIRRFTWPLVGGIVASALLASGGRGGLVACVVAFVLLPLAAGETGRAVRFVAYAGAAAVMLSGLGVSALSFERLRPAPLSYERLEQDQYGSGRLDIYRASLREAAKHPIIGGGFEAASLTGLQGEGSARRDASGASGALGQSSGHNVILALVLAGGILLAVTGFLILVRAGTDAWIIARRSTSWMWLGSAVTVFLVRGLFESDGGLIGAQNVLLFSALCTAAAGVRAHLLLQPDKRSLV
jgi:hypothetical protein